MFYKNVYLYFVIKIKMVSACQHFFLNEIMKYGLQDEDFDKTHLHFVNYSS